MDWINVYICTYNRHEVYDFALTNINMYAIFTLLSLLLLLLLPGDNADLLKINYGKLLEQCMEIIRIYIHILCLLWIDCMHSPFSHHPSWNWAAWLRKSLWILSVFLVHTACCIQNTISPHARIRIYACVPCVICIPFIKSSSSSSSSLSWNGIRNLLRI